jgi:hypothetical protein
LDLTAQVTDFTRSRDVASSVEPSSDVAGDDPSWQLRKTRDGEGQVRPTRSILLQGDAQSRRTANRRAKCHSHDAKTKYVRHALLHSKVA